MFFYAIIQQPGFPFLTFMNIDGVVERLVELKECSKEKVYLFVGIVFAPPIFF